VLYHSNTTSQCNLIRQLVRKLRPGGRAWFGGNYPSSSTNIQQTPFRRRDWLRCLISQAMVGGIPVDLEFVPDAALFRDSMNTVGTIEGDYLYFGPTFSVIVRRLDGHMFRQGRR
ncbi:unnamed protein product, partial [Polarella glacialis]